MVAVPLWASASPVALDDDALGSVAAQDGLQVQIDLPASGIGINEWRWTADAAPSPYAQSLRLSGLNASGSQPVNLAFDVGTSAGVPRLAMHADWNNLRLRSGGITVGGYPGNSAGQMFIDTTGSLDLVNNGIFNSAYSSAYINLTSVGDVMYRQGGTGSPELSLRNFNFGFRTTNGSGGVGYGTLGVNATDGIYVLAPHMDFDLNFDLYYAVSPVGDFDKVNRAPLVLFGWEGGIRNARLQLGGGGIGYGNGAVNYGHVWGSLDSFNYNGAINPALRTQGLNILAQWDFDTNYAWILGESAGNRNQVRFFNWQRMGGNTPSPTAYTTGGAAPYDLRFPILVDMINASQGPGNICFGGSLPTSGSLTAAGCSAVGGALSTLAPDSAAMAVIMRDARVHAYNTQVAVVDAPNPDEVFNWSLVYTFGKLDANVYLYPVGYGGASTGLKADVNLAIQSPGYWRAARSNFNQFPAVANDPGADLSSKDRWATNTHFLIADTNTAKSPTCVAANNCGQFGIGVLNADLLWRANDLYVRFMGPSSIRPGIWLHAENGALYRFRGLFGGGDLRNLSNPVRIALLDVNLETSQFMFAAIPPVPGENYFGFSGVLDFNGNAYMSLAEPSQPTAEFRLDNISGRLVWDNGRVDLRSAAENPDGKPSLSIRNDLLIGTTAATIPDIAGTGTAFLTTVKFGAGLPNNGDGSFGRVAIPSGMWFSDVSLKKQ
ncbi:MAG: hypothetical protein ACK4ZS_03330 [Sulfurimicrobium sp.]